MSNFNKINNILGWTIFSIASFVYLSTIEQTVSFWDCGEYISTAYKLEVGHPPGAPLFQLLGRIFHCLLNQPQAKLQYQLMFYRRFVAHSQYFFFFGQLLALLKK